MLNTANLRQYVTGHATTGTCSAVLSVPSLLEGRPLVPPEGPLAPETQALPKSKD